MDDLEMFGDDFSIVLDRLNIEWITLVALREAVAVTLKDTSVVYKDTLRLAEVLVPALFHQDRSLLQRHWESPEARECREIATSMSISFEEAVKDEIQRYEKMTQKGKLEDTKTLRHKLTKLKQISQEARSRKYYEGRLIHRDSSVGVDLPISKRGDDYNDFALPRNRVMRVRVTHETEIEDINGADLVYEHHWVKEEKVRVAAIQYKMMQKERYISKSKDLRDQISRLRNNFCSRIPCTTNDHTQPNHFFRLPYCSAFLRATNKLQSTDASTVSTGYYMPICRVNNLIDKKLEICQDNIPGETVNFRVFEGLFNSGVLGSRWLTYRELEEIHREQKILEANDTVAIHVQIMSF